MVADPTFWGGFVEVIANGYPIEPRLIESAPGCAQFADLEVLLPDVNSECRGHSGYVRGYSTVSPGHALNLYQKPIPIPLHVEA